MQTNRRFPRKGGRHLVYKNMEKQIKVIDKREDPFVAVSKIAYEQGLKDGRNESGLYAIIPMSILENKKLSANAKLLYGEIMALSKKSGKCYATNEHLSECLGLSKRSIPALIKELSGIGLLMVSIDRSSKGTYRDIVVSFFNDGGYSSLAMGGVAKQRGQKRNRQSRNIQREESSSSKKPKRFYRNQEMRFAQNKWWVLPKDVGEWLEFDMRAFKETTTKL